VRWRKRGEVWRPNGELSWARKYASCPTPYKLPDGSLRIYVQCRDDHNVGRVGYVDVDSSDPMKVLSSSSQPVLDVGAPGSFDDNGVFQTSILQLADGRLLMYYVGFELCHRIRYRLLTGLAVSEDGGGTFRRVRNAPVLERSDREAHFRCGPHVLLEGGRYRMWYVAGSQWIELAGKSVPVYDIRYLESADGVRWPEEGRLAIPLDEASEHGFGRPYVVREGRRLRMFYSIRRKSPPQCRLGYAESEDGLKWRRLDDALRLDVTPGAWDGESIEYPAVVKSGGRTWMFYNGNDFGATGFGVAELESE
jgi:predicted GH43/DUF377 family glycosyl hydrolase